MTIIRNLTPHALQLLTEQEGGPIVGSVGFGRAARQSSFRLVAELVSEGVARAATHSEAAGAIEMNGEQFPVTATVFGEVQDLPEARPDVRLVVSKITADAATAGGRSTDDLLVVGEAVRDAEGKILGVTSFGCVV